MRHKSSKGNRAHWQQLPCAQLVITATCATEATLPQTCTLPPYCTLVGLRSNHKQAQCLSASAPPLALSVRQKLSGWVELPGVSCLFLFQSLRSDFTLVHGKVLSQKNALKFLSFQRSEVDQTAIFRVIACGPNASNLLCYVTHTHVLEYRKCRRMNIHPLHTHTSICR